MSNIYKKIIKENVRIQWSPFLNRVWQLFCHKETKAQTIITISYDYSFTKLFTFSLIKFWNRLFFFFISLCVLVNLWLYWIDQIKNYRTGFSELLPLFFHNDFYICQLHFLQNFLRIASPLKTVFFYNYFFGSL